MRGDVRDCKGGWQARIEDCVEVCVVRVRSRRCLAPSSNLGVSSIVKPQVSDRVITIPISFNPFHNPVQTNLAAGTWLCCVHGSGDLYSKYAVWALLDAFLGCFRAGAHAKRGIGRVFGRDMLVRLDLVMRWIMRENERMEWRSAGLCENGNRIAAGKCYSKCSSRAFMLSLRGG
jgi:hypothetical protein